MKDRVGQLWVIVAALVFEAPHVVRQNDRERIDTREALFQIFTMSLHRGAERPVIHAIRSDADRTAAATGAERQDLIEPVEQPGPLLFLDKPFKLRPVAGELRLAEPLAEMLKGLLLDAVVHLNASETIRNLVQQLHEMTSPYDRLQALQSIRTPQWLAR